MGSLHLFLFQEKNFVNMITSFWYLAYLKYLLCLQFARNFAFFLKLKVSQILNSLPTVYELIFYRGKNHWIHRLLLVIAELYFMNFVWFAGWKKSLEVFDFHDLWEYANFTFMIFVMIQIFQIKISVSLCFYFESWIIKRLDNQMDFCGRSLY